MIENQQSWNWFPTRHQPSVAILLVLGLLTGGVYFLLKRFEQGSLADIDQLQKRSVMYQVDLNTAHWPELVVLPGIGEKLAKTLVQHRTKFGPFLRHEDIMDVHGIGDLKLAALKPYLLPIPNSD